MTTTQVKSGGLEFVEKKTPRYRQSCVEATRKEPERYKTQDGVPARGGLSVLISYYTYWYPDPLPGYVFRDDLCKPYHDKEGRGQMTVSLGTGRILHSLESGAEPSGEDWVLRAEALKAQEEDCRWLPVYQLRVRQMPWMLRKQLQKMAN